MASLAPTLVLVPGTWTIDPVHSEVSFSVRHLMFSKVRGTFKRFSGTIATAADVAGSAVEATIDAASIDTRDDRRDADVRSARFFDVERYPEITYRSTGIRADAEDYVLHGELTLHGVTRPVDLSLQLNGVGPDPWGGTRAAFTATTELNRRDFGIDINMPLDGGGVVVGDRVSIQLEIQAVLEPPQA